MRRTLLFAVPAASLLLASLVGGAEAPRAPFEVKDLGTLGGQTSGAYALNETGQVAGSAEAADGSTQAFVFRGGRMVDLGRGTAFRNTEAFGINDAGQVVGAGSTERQVVTQDTGKAIGSVPVSRALLWEGEKVQDLAAGKARDINNRGQVVGHTVAGPGFLWEKGRLTQLSDPEAGCGLHGHAINDAGEIAGETVRTGRSRSAFRWKAGAYELLEVGYTGGAPPGAFALNGKGEVVGVGGGFDGEAFFWSGGKITRLGTLNGPVEVGPLGQHAGYHYSVGLGVNDQGQVVGTGSVTVNGTNELRAFLWEKGRLTPLTALIDPKSGWTLEQARAINNKGQICGVGKLNGRKRAFLLTPAN